MFVTPEDLAPFADIDLVKAQAMIKGVEALALTAVPKLRDVTDQVAKDAIATILTGAILRWHEAGSGALSTRSKTAGIFGVNETIDTRQSQRPILRPIEVQQLRDLVEARGGRQAFSIDTAPGGRGGHIPWCNLHMGGTYCSCGANINRYEEPLFEGGILSPGGEP